MKIAHRTRTSTRTVFFCSLIQNIYLYIICIIHGAVLWDNLMPSLSADVHCWNLCIVISSYRIKLHAIVSMQFVLCVAFRFSNQCLPVSTNCECSKRISSVQKRCGLELRPTHTHMNAETMHANHIVFSASHCAMQYLCHFFSHRFRNTA